MRYVVPRYSLLRDDNREHALPKGREGKDFARLVRKETATSDRPQLPDNELSRVIVIKGTCGSHECSRRSDASLHLETYG